MTCLLSGCSAGSPAPSDEGREARLAGSLTELFERELADSDDPFVRDVLERAVDTGKITQADYDDAHELSARCMADLGYELTFERRKNGTQEVTPPFFDTQEELDEYADASAGCADQIAVIESLYLTQVGNPGLLSDPTAVVVACLTTAGLTPSGYDGDDFSRDLEAGAQFPFDSNSVDAQDCFSSGGFSIENGSS